MKLTPWKINRVLYHIPEQDQLEIKKELAEQNTIIEEFDEATGTTVSRRKGVSSETMSRLALMHNAVSLQKPKQKGAFGKKGTNRKLQLFQQRLVMKELFEKAKAELEEEHAEDTEQSSTEDDQAEV